MPGHPRAILALSRSAPASRTFRCRGRRGPASLLDSLGCASVRFMSRPRQLHAGLRAAQACLGEFDRRRFSAPDWAAFSTASTSATLMQRHLSSLEPAHPSDNWAAVMAAGQLAGADGKAWIAAAAVAYEVQCGFANASSIRAGDGITTPTARSRNPRGGMLLELTPEQTVHALESPPTTHRAAAHTCRRAFDVEGLALRLHAKRPVRRSPGR